MQNIITDIQDQVVSSIEDSLTDSDGSQHMSVERIYTQDEFAIADFVADNDRRIARIPHAFVFVGTLNFVEADSTGRAATVEAPVRVFVATRDASTSNQQIQHDKAAKWSTYVAAALAGTPIQSKGTNTAYVMDPNVEPLGNTERNALWEVRLNIELVLDSEIILQEIDNE